MIARKEAARQVIFSVSADLGLRLDLVAQGLGLPLSDLIRRVVAEGLPAYERRLDPEGSDGDVDL